MEGCTHTEQTEGGVIDHVRVIHENVFREGEITQSQLSLVVKSCRRRSDVLQPCPFCATIFNDEQSYEDHVAEELRIHAKTLFAASSSRDCPRISQQGKTLRQSYAGSSGVLQELRVELPPDEKPSTYRAEAVDNIDWDDGVRTPTQAALRCVDSDENDSVRLTEKLDRPQRDYWLFNHDESTLHQPTHKWVPVLPDNQRSAGSFAPALTYKVNLATTRTDEVFNDSAYETASETSSAGEHVFDSPQNFWDTLDCGPTDFGDFIPQDEALGSKLEALGSRLDPVYSIDMMKGSSDAWPDQSTRATETSDTSADAGKSRETAVFSRKRKKYAPHERDTPRNRDTPRERDGCVKCRMQHKQVGLKHSFIFEYPK